MAKKSVGKIKVGSVIDNTPVSKTGDEGAIPSQPEIKEITEQEKEYMRKNNYDEYKRRFGK